MLTFLIILAIVVVGVVVWRRRVPLLAKLLGQSESRIRQINRKRVGWLGISTLVASAIAARQSTSSLAFRSSNALVARSARTSTRFASASRGRFSRK